MDIFSSQIQTIKEMLDWRVSLDILLLAILIFFLYHTLRTTGTWKIVLGIMLAAAIFVVARFLDLKGIGWIYSNLSQILLLAFVIIFQPELRKIFERVASIRRKDIGGEGSTLSLMISDVAFVLAEQRRGALIVLPGRDSIKAWTSEGIQLDARPSFPLLMSIFDPHSPGHDGAIIIENGKVTSFAVKLPLSKSSILSEEYGTRHHAGLGLSEMTDALVIAVSEERGSITLFSQGTVEKVTTKNRLASQIMTHWKNSASYLLFSRGEKRKRIVVGRLALSFILAFLFWSTVVLTQSTLRKVAYTVPIEYSSMPKNLILVGEKPTDVKISLLGSIVDLNNLNAQQLTVHVNLSKLSHGKNIIHLTANDVQLPKGVKLIDINPSGLELNLIEIKEVEAIVKPQFIGALPQGVEMDSVEIAPNTIRVFTPVDIVTDTGIVLLTSPIYLENVREDMTLFCNIITPPAIRPIDNLWPNVRVNLTLKKKDR